MNKYEQLIEYIINDNNSIQFIYERFNAQNAGKRNLTKRNKKQKVNSKTKKNKNKNNKKRKTIIKNQKIIHKKHHQQIGQ